MLIKDGFSGKLKQALLLRNLLYFFREFDLLFFMFAAIVFFCFLFGFNHTNRTYFILMIVWKEPDLLFDALAKMSAGRKSGGYGQEQNAKKQAE
jgi:hypothetical protein